MTQIADSLPFLISGLIGVVAVGWWGFSKVREARKRFWSRKKGALLRPPAHTLSERLSEHAEGAFPPLAGLFLGSGIAGAFLWAVGVALVSLISNDRFHAEFKAKGWSVLTSAPRFWPAMLSLILGFVGGVGLIWWGRKKFYLWLREGYRLRMGLKGEQATAEELQIAVRAGYHLFHDVPMAGMGCNIDHVIVGRGGVFAIETKARSKPEGAESKEPRATFDSTRVELLGVGYDSRVARQAEANAKWLAETLTRSTGRQVRVKAVIALPGWYVEPNDFPQVIARNPEYFAKELRDAAEVLSAGEISAIAFQVERMCRDVAL